MWRAYRARGAKIVSTWIDEAGEGETADFTELWHRIQTEIWQCTRLVFYAEASDFPLKGAIIETGMALAFGRPVWVLGKGIKLEGRTARPFGSWIYHPSVEMVRPDVTDDFIASALGL